MLTNGPRGTKDILPDAVGEWRYVEEKIRAICGSYGYREIRTPMFEHTELFRRGIGDATDVVDKEMYTFEDRGGRSITLRPENTAAAVRAYLQNKLYAEGFTKLFYIGSMFRYDRPQAGRMREFHQFGVEALGGASPAVDAEVILLAVNFLKSLGLDDLALHLNSVGCPHCRPVYRRELQGFLQAKKSDLCHDCQDRFDRNPMRILDCKEDNAKGLLDGVPEIADYLCDECREHFERVQAYLKAEGIAFELDPRLVRGLDYYTKTAFEIQYAPLGAQSAVAGGGRYDGLIEEIGGSPTPAVGFAAGLERVLLALEKQNLLPEEKQGIDAYVVALGDAAQIPAFRLQQELRDAGLSVAMDYAGRSMKAQMKQAGKTGACLAFILGEDEAAQQSVMLRDMGKSEQQLIPMKEAVGKAKELCRK